MTPHAEDFAHGSRTKAFFVDSPNVTYTASHIHSKYTYHTTSVSGDDALVVRPRETTYEFKVDRTVGRVGLMLVGWGGNNGSTVTAGIIANRRNLTWATREGAQSANYYGSVMMTSTMKLGVDAKGRDVNIPLHDALPMVHPDNLVLGGWDINSLDLAGAMDRARVLQPTLKEQVRSEMSRLHPMRSIYYPDFIAANQEDRADHVLPGSQACMGHVEQIRKDIR